MLRRIVFFGIAAAAILAVSVWAVGRPAAVTQDGSPSEPNKKTGPSFLNGSLGTKGGLPASTTKTAGQKPIGQDLYAQASPTAPRPAARLSDRREISADPILIHYCRVKLLDEEEVPSQRDGVLLFIGTELKEGEKAPPHEVVEVKMGSGTNKMESVTKWFRRLKEGDQVQADQLVALVDDTLAHAEEEIKVAKLESAKADKEAADHTRDEAQQRYETQKRLYGGSRGGLGATSLEELRGAQLTHVRYVYEAMSKVAAITVAIQELNQARKTLEMYEIRPKISGVVKTIHKHRGESIKSLDPVVLIQNYDHLRVDGFVEEQYANHLEKGMEVVIEPTIRESPKLALIGHRQEITGVAVSKDPQKPMIVSCSHDNTVRVWERLPTGGRVRESRVLKHPDHPAPVWAVACTPPGAEYDLCLTGDAEGRGSLWDLQDKNANKPLRDLRGQHLKGISCVAFSPNGQMCATGGAADKQIMVWETKTGRLLHQIPGHIEIVTSLHFASNSLLVSASRDRTVRFWKLGTDSAEQLKNETIKRSETQVAQLGVSPDGQRIMDEHNGELRIISVPGSRTEAILRNTNHGRPFRNFALFSPDGRLALTTTGELDGIVQLWRIDPTRSYELRQFVSPVRSEAKAAAFAPDGSFVVGAVKDSVYVWPMPSKAEVEERITAIITNVEKPIDLTKSEVKVAAELVNPGQRLRPGDVATIVAYPQK